MITFVRRTAMLGLAFILVAPAGCVALSDINPLDRGSSEPLPPVTGNVIATSSSRDLAERIGTTEDPAADPITDPDAVPASPSDF